MLAFHCTHIVQTCATDYIHVFVEYDTGFEVGLLDSSHFNKFWLIAWVGLLDVIDKWNDRGQWNAHDIDCDDSKEEWEDVDCQREHNIGFDN